MVKHVQRPWGSFCQYTHNEDSTVKVLTVKAGARTSLQSHNLRKELWVALDEGLLVQIKDTIVDFNKGSSLLIDIGQKHRITCKGPKEARILEISFGDFREEDIVRHEDDYGRQAVIPP